jgi:hypothetical protein
MEKIKDLLGKIGASKQLQEALIVELDNFVKTTEAKYEKLFKERKEKAVKVCTEEVENYKRELAGKVAVFLESKQAQMARANEKQLALEGSEAADKLSRVKAVVEGIKLNDAGAVTNENKQLHERALALEQANARLIAERDLTTKRAVRAQTIANDVLKANRLLESKLQKGETVKEEFNTKVLSVDEKQHLLADLRDVLAGQGGTEEMKSKLQNMVTNLETELEPEAKVGGEDVTGAVAEADTEAGTEVAAEAGTEAGTEAVAEAGAGAGAEVAAEADDEIAGVADSMDADDDAKEHPVLPSKLSGSPPFDGEVVEFADKKAGKVVTESLKSLRTKPATTIKTKAKTAVDPISAIADMVD